MWLRTEPKEVSDTKICTLPEGTMIEIIEEFKTSTQVKTKCPNGDSEKGFIFNYDGERPFEKI